ncbi:MAG: hypothetical protein AAFR61_04010 [Bacteroidota bacterium]
MPSWIIKASSQKLLTAIPGYRHWYPWCQRHFFGSLQLSPYFVKDRLEHVGRHLKAWQQIHPNRLPERVLEFGSGWYPLVPLGLYLCGVKKVVLTDRYQLFKPADLDKLINFIEDELWDKLPEILPGFQQARWKQLKEILQLAPEQRLSDLGWTYQVGDILQKPPTGSFDLLISNNTFEHLAPKLLNALMPFFWQCLKPAGVMSHYVDMVDHYSYFDPSLPAFHFLRFSPRQWSWIENSLQAQNRWRLDDYQALWERHQLPIDACWPELLPEDRIAPEQWHPSFHHQSETSTRAGYVQIISVKKETP